MSLASMVNASGRYSIDQAIKGFVNQFEFEDLVGLRKIKQPGYATFCNSLFRKRIKIEDLASTVIWQFYP